MKRAAICLALAAFVTAPAAAQWLGMPVWNSPKGGTGITINGDWGRPDSTSGKGNAFGGRASLGLGTLTLTAGVASYKPENATRSEEHTSELQSQSNLVCRLLLEKKK